MNFDELEEDYLEALWESIHAEIDEDLDGQPEEQLDYLKLKYEIRRDKNLLKCLEGIQRQLAKVTRVTLN